MATFNAMKRALSKVAPQMSDDETGQLEKEPDNDDMPPARLAKPFAPRKKTV